MGGIHERANRHDSRHRHSCALRGRLRGDDDSETTTPAGETATQSTAATDTAATDTAAKEEYVQQVKEALQPTITASQELQTEAAGISSRMSWHRS